MEPERESKKTCIIKRRNLKALHHHDAIRGRGEMQRQSEKREKDKRCQERC